LRLVTAKVSHYETLCNKIMDSDSTIRFAGIVTHMGRLIAGGFREGVTPIMDEKELETLFMQVALRIRMRSEFDSHLGPVNFTISHRDNAVVTSVPFDDKILYVSADKEFDLAKTPFKIMDILREKLN